MKKKHVNSLVFVGFFIIVTGVAMGSLSRNTPSSTAQPPDVGIKTGVVTVSAHLVQDKIFTGGDGTVALFLSMHADDVLVSDEGEGLAVDMVIVLDQSGSMRGQKIEYARQAILNLLSSLSARDRFAIIGYADNVWKYSDLMNVTSTNRKRLETIIHRISVGGNTNLGGGLQEGINALLANHSNGNMGKVVLISDGLANRGIIHPEALGNIASIAVEEEFGISTVGVGQNFNEQLMTAIADKGAGNYYYLANPQSFAQVFSNEFQHSRTIVAHAVEIRIPLPDGVSLVEASGYPITVNNNQAIVHPGDLLSGQTRKLFLTLKVPTHAEETYELPGINVRYKHDGTPYTAAFSETFRIACVSDPQDAVASIVQTEWEEKVLQEDFNALRERVAVDLKNGKKEEALKQINHYYDQQQLLNKEVGSAEVTDHLEKDLDKLRDVVEQTFKGSQQEIEKQQKAQSKALQYEGYNNRRSK